MPFIIIFCAKYLIGLSVLLGAYALWTLPAEKRNRAVLAAAITLPLAYLIAKTLSHFYFDPRPFVVGNFTPLIPHAADNGFPSDHTLLAAAIAAVVSAARPRIAIALWIIAIAVGAARVLSGVHHAIDIAGSIAVALVAAAVVEAAFRYFKPAPLE